jgi:hypothetical protein
MTSKLPPKHDPQRDALEKKALKARDKTEQTVEALKEGKLPTTGQITGTIDRIQGSDSLHATGQGMSPLGKRVLADTERLLESTKKVLDEKNSGDELQNIIYHGSRGAKNLSDTTIVTDDLKQKVQTQTSTAQQELSPTAQEAYKKILKIPGLIMSNTEFRLLLNEFNSIIQDAISVNLPRQQQQQQDVNQGEQDYNDQNQIQQGDGNGNNKQYPLASTEISADAQDPDQTKREIRQTASEVAGNTTQQLRGNVYPLAQTAANLGGQHIKEFSEGNKSLKDTATDSAKTFKSAVQDNIVAYKLSDQQRDQLTERFKNVMIQTHKNPEFQDAISELVNLVSQVASHTKQITKHVSDSLTDTHGSISSDESTQIAIQNAKSLVEHFSSNRSLDPLINSIRELGAQVQKDQDLRNYFADLQDYINKSLYDTQFVEDSDYIQHGSRLIKSGRDLLLDKYRNLTQDVQRELSAFNEAIQSDTTTIRWAKDFDRLVSDLFLDERGKPTLKFELVKDISKIVPVITDQFQYLALPKIENSDDQYDFAFDNVVLHMPEILPKHVHISITSDINLDREADNVLQNFALLEVSKVRADARNIKFYYKKKKGMINMTDAGLVDFALPDNGIQFHMRLLLLIPGENRPHLEFHVLEASTKIDTLKFRLHDTKHDVLYTLLTPLVENKVKHQLESLITEKMKVAVEYLEENLQRIQDQVTRIQQNVNFGTINSNISSIAGSIGSNINNIASTIKNNTKHPTIQKVADKARGNDTETPRDDDSNDNMDTDNREDWQPEARDSDENWQTGARDDSDANNNNKNKQTGPRDSAAYGINTTTKLPSSTTPQSYPVEE